MGIERFPLAWRWTSPTHAVLPPQILAGLRPVEPSTAQKLHASVPSSLGPAALTHHASESEEQTSRWLRSLPVASDEVTIVWGPELALALPWETFASYWSDFCYPSSDDAAVLFGAGGGVLLWHHYEVFEYSDGAL